MLDVCLSIEVSRFLTRSLLQSPVEKILFFSEDVLKYHLPIRLACLQKNSPSRSTTASNTSLSFLHKFVSRRMAATFSSVCLLPGVQKFGQRAAA